MSADTELNETDLELISSSLDEDLSEFERRRLNNSVLARTEGEKTWVRYNAVSAVMKKQFPAQIDKDFSSQVMQAISEQGYEQEEESATQVKIKRVGSYMKQITGLAVAASVAAFSIVTYQNLYPTNTPTIDAPEVALSQQEAADEMKPAEVLAIQNSQRVEFAPATAQQATTVRQIELPTPAQRSLSPHAMQPQVEENFYFQELNPYIQNHAGYGSQRIITPYVEIIELKDVQK